MFGLGSETYGDQGTNCAHQGRDENDEQKAKGGTDVRVSIRISRGLEVDTRHIDESNLN